MPEKNKQTNVGQKRIKRSNATKKWMGNQKCDEGGKAIYFMQKYEEGIQNLTNNLVY